MPARSSENTSASDISGAIAWDTSREAPATHSVVAAARMNVTENRIDGIGHPGAESPLSLRVVRSSSFVIWAEKRADIIQKQNVAKIRRTHRRRSVPTSGQTRAAIVPAAAPQIPTSTAIAVNRRNTCIQLASHVA